MSPTLTNDQLKAWLTKNGKKVGGYNYLHDGPDFDVNDMHHSTDGQRSDWKGEKKPSHRNAVSGGTVAGRGSTQTVAGRPQSLVAHTVQGTRSADDYQY